MSKLLPIILALAGLATGVGAGIFLKPQDAHTAEAEACAPLEGGDTLHEVPAAETVYDYVKMNNQFVVPVVEDGRMASLVVLSLSLEVVQGQQESIFAREPKLRDAFLQVMFDHANSGGFKGEFTSARNMTILRDALKQVSHSTVGPIVNDVLIIDIVRQDA